MVSAERSFQDLLQKEFQIYKSKNRRFSLRSFAKYLELAPTTLHQYLHGRYGPSSKNLRKMADKLGWPKETLDELLEASKPLKPMSPRDIPLSPQSLDFKLSSLNKLKETVVSSGDKSGFVVTTICMNPEKFKSIEQEFVRFVKRMELKYPGDKEDSTYEILMGITLS